MYGREEETDSNVSWERRVCRLSWLAMEQGLRWEQGSGHDERWAVVTVLGLSLSGWWRVKEVAESVMSWDSSMGECGVWDGTEGRNSWDAMREEYVFKACSLMGGGEVLAYAECVACIDRTSTEDTFNDLL